MSDFNPSVLRRVLALRRFPVFADADLAELVTLAENVAERHFAAGAVVAEAATRLPALHLVLDGQIDCGGTVWRAHQIFGALEVLANRQLVAPAVATGETRTLQLFASDVGELLEDSFGVMRTTLRGLSAAALSRGMLASRKPLRSDRPVTAAPLGLVERMLVLRQQPLFANSRLDALATLSHLSEEVRWSSGDVIARAGELADGALFVVEGMLGATFDSGVVRQLGPGDTIGGVETLADARHLATVAALADVRGLRCSGTAIFDVIEDHADFGLAMIGTVAGALLDAAVARPGATGATG